MKRPLKPISIILLLFICFTSCNQKEVKLPVLNVSGIQDTIYDNSQIWIFFKIKDGDTIAELNRKNSIASTNWIYNIDKRLTLYQLVPHLKKMTEKREKPSMHQKDEDDTNYFSYVDSGSNKLSMVQFNSIQYTTEPLNFDSLSISKRFKHIQLNYTKNGISINNTNIKFETINQYLLEQLSDRKLKVYLNFDENVSYQDYIHLKAILSNNKKDSIEFDKNEYVNF